MSEFILGRCNADDLAAKWYDLNEELEKLRHREIDIERELSDIMQFALENDISIMERRCNL